MEFDEKYAAIMMQRVSNSNDEFERIDLVSKSDKQRFPIHRVILMAASKYFAKLLRTNDSTKKPNEFVVNSSGEAIEKVVHFCYTGRIDLTEQNVEDCSKIAVDGEFDLLLNKCHDYFSTTSSMGNAVDVLLTASKYTRNELQHRTSKPPSSHFEKNSATHICQLNPAAMMHLMEADDDTITSELVVNRLLCWFQYDEAGRGEHLPKMLRLIQLEQLSSEFLCKTIEPLFKQFECVHLLYDEFKRRSMPNTLSSGCFSAKETGDEAVMSDNTAICCVTGLNDLNTNGHKPKFIVERYDETLKKFTPHFKLPPTDIDGQKPVLYGNKIFMIGGCRYGVATDSIAYDMKTGKKERLRSMNDRRYDQTSIIMEKSIYVFGGYRGFEYLSSCERYDTVKRTWRTIKSMNHKRALASAVIVDGLIYVVGGFDVYGSTNFVESYDPRTDQWTERMALDKAEPGQPLVAFNGMLYAFLGDREVREYDPSKNVWTKIQANYRFESVIYTNGSLFGMTRNGCFGKMTINERKIDFVMNAEVDKPHLASLSLHQCRFEK